MRICLDSPGLILTLIPDFKRCCWTKLYLLSNLYLPLFFLTKAAAMFTSAERWSDRWRGRAVATHPPCTLSCFRQKPRHLKRKQCETVFRQSRDTSDWSMRNSADFDQTLIKWDHFLNMSTRFRVSLPILSEISALTDEFAVVRDRLKCRKDMRRNEKSEVERWLFLSVSLCLQKRRVLALVPRIEGYLDICE